MNSGASDSRPSDARSRPSTGGALTMAIASTELVEREIRIDAPPSVVFEFLTDPAKMVRWMGTEAVLEPWPGGRYYEGPGERAFVTRRRDPRASARFRSPRRSRNPTAQLRTGRVGGVDGESGGASAFA